jgi:hypothetical protein
MASRGCATMHSIFSGTPRARPALARFAETAKTVLAEVRKRPLTILSTVLNAYQRKRDLASPDRERRM